MAECQTLRAPRSHLYANCCENADVPPNEASSLRAPTSFRHCVWQLAALVRRPPMSATNSDPLASQFRGDVSRAACDHNGLKARFKPSTHLAVRLPASHMTLSQADPNGSMT